MYFLGSAAQLQWVVCSNLICLEYYYIYLYLKYIIIGLILQTRSSKQFFNVFNEGTKQNYKSIQQGLLYADDAAMVVESATQLQT